MKRRFLKDVAEALYLGIVHDTGVFQYSCAGPETFRVAAKLLEKGIDAPKIIEETFYAKSYAQNLVMGRALMESILFLNGTGIASFIRKDVMEFLRGRAERSGRNCKPAPCNGRGRSCRVYV